MSAERGVRARIVAAFTENVGLKVVSLFCALAIYAFHGTENAQRVLSVGVLSLMPDSSRVLLAQLPSEVMVTLKGSKSQLDDLKPDDLGAVNLDLREGNLQRLDLDASMMHVPAGLTVESMTPASIQLAWDDVVERAMPVQVPRTGDPSPGYVVKTAASNPATITVRGPRTVVDDLQAKGLRALPFDVTDLKEGVHPKTLFLEPPPNLTKFSARSVEASVTIGREIRKAQFARVRVEVVGLPKAVAKPPSVEVDLSGSVDDVEAITAEDIVPRVEPKALTDVDTTKPGSAMLDVVLELHGVEVDVRPKKVLVTW